MIKPRALLVDLDGTVNRGNTLIPGVKDFYESSKLKGIQWLFISNNASRLDFELAEKLMRLGLEVSHDQVISSATALIYAIRNGFRDKRFFVVGEPNLIGGLTEAGAIVTQDPDNTDIVVTALDTGMTYNKIRDAHLAIQKGAIFWATNLDPTYPMEQGFHPGAGCIVAALATAAGRPPDRLFGKPSSDMAPIALENLGCRPEEVLVVGDRMDTDILFAKNAGLRSVLVLTGATARDDIAQYDYKPDYIIDHIADLEQVLHL